VTIDGVWIDDAHDSYIQVITALSLISIIH
jgi:hypothetical protein